MFSYQFILLSGFLFSRRQQIKESPKRKMQQVSELPNDVQEVNVEIYNVSSKSPKRGRNIGARKQANEVKETPKQISKRVSKGKVTTEAEPATESRLTRGTRARLNTNKADYQSKTRPSPNTKSRKGTKSSNMVNESKREITQETQSRSSRRAKAENSVSVTQTAKGRRRKIDQVIIENRPLEPAFTPKRTRNAQQQVPFAEKISLKPKGTHAKTQENQALPKKTRQGKVTVESPVKGTRSRRNKTEDKTVSNTKKRRTSLVVGKKPPVMSPHAATSTRKAKKQISPITERSKRVVSTLRTKSEVKLASQKAVKTTRAKLVVVTPSPKMNPHVKTRAHIQCPPKEPPKKSQSETTKRERRNAGKPKQNTSSNQSKGRNVVEQKSKPDLPKKRGRRNADKSEQNTFPVQNKVRSKVEQESKPDPPKKRGRRTANKSVIVEEPPNKRSRKIAEKSEGKPETTVKSTSDDTYPKRGRIARSNVIQPVKIVTKPQGKKVAVQESTQAAPGKRNPRTKAEGTSLVPETRKGRKRKNEDEQQVVPAKVAKSDTKVTRGRKTTDVTNPSAPARQKRSTKDNKKETLKNEKLKDSKTVQNKTTQAQTTKKAEKEAIKMKPKATKPVKGNKVGLIIIC